MRVNQSLAVVLSFFLASHLHAENPVKQTEKTGIYIPTIEVEAKTNIIFLIGDGMGNSYTSAYRFYHDDPATPDLERTIFDELLSGMSSTYPDKIYGITDSAAAATALVTGKKTYDGALGLDAERHSVETIFERAKKMGYLTGAAVTCQVNHATPAAFFSHQEDRENYDSIANEYLDEKINGKPKFDLLLGGGQNFFLRKDRNLIKEFKKLGYSYTDSIENLSQIKSLPAIGLFAKVGLPFAVDSDHPLRLKEMTAKSLDLLSDSDANKKPFFLMLEASQIDWCGHANDIVCAMGEVNDMAETMKLIKAFVDRHPNTIFIATADHSTGGLSMGAKGIYEWRAPALRKIKASSGELARKLVANASTWQDVWNQFTSIQLNDEEIKNMDSIVNKTVQDNSDANRNYLQDQIKLLFDKATATGWTTHGHTGEDVQIFSYGKGAEKFRGSMDNTDIAKKLFSYLE